MPIVTTQLGIGNSTLSGHWNPTLSLSNSTLLPSGSSVSSFSSQNTLPNSTWSDIWKRRPVWDEVLALRLNRSLSLLIFPSVCLLPYFVLVVNTTILNSNELISMPVGTRGPQGKAWNDQLWGSGGKQKSKSHKAECWFGGVAEASLSYPLGRVAFLVFCVILFFFTYWFVWSWYWFVELYTAVSSRSSQCSTSYYWVPREAWLKRWAESDWSVVQRRQCQRLYLQRSRLRRQTAAQDSRTRLALLIHCDIFTKKNHPLLLFKRGMQWYLKETTGLGRHACSEAE